MSDCKELANPRRGIDRPNAVMGRQAQGMEEWKHEHHTEPQEPHGQNMANGDGLTRRYSSKHTTGRRSWVRLTSCNFPLEDYNHGSLDKKQRRIPGRENKG